MRCLVGTLALLLWASVAMASRLPPCFRAVSSAAGSFFVITDTEYPHGLLAKADTVITLQIIQGTYQKQMASNTYWRGDFGGWSVRLAKGDGLWSSCPLPLISEDGEFLILLYKYSFDSALRIYRRPEQEHIGVQVRDIAIKEIWPDQKWHEWHDTVQDDSSPEWFEGGTFEFSSDSRVLIHKTRWGNVVRIHLSDGTVSH